MSNKELEQFFTNYAKLLELHDEDNFKIKSYQAVAFTLSRLKEPIENMTTQDLLKIRGIGGSIADKISELISSGTIADYESLLLNTPHGVIDMMKIKGLGAQKIKLIWKGLGVTNMQELENACLENKLISLKGFSAKTQANVLEQIQFFKNNQNYYLWCQVEATAMQWLEKLRQSFRNNRFELCGQFYRQIELVDTVEIITDLPLQTLYKIWENAPNIDINIKQQYLLLSIEGMIPIKIYYAESLNFGLQQFLYSASDSFLEAFKAAYQIPKNALHEEDIFKYNNLDFIPAPRRENISYCAKSLPKPVVEKDIKGIVHAHSIYSDGAESLEVMVQYAISKHFEYLVITDHSQSAYYANGLKPETIFKQHLEIELLNKKYAPFKIFKGIESDILNDGNLDYEPEVLSLFDIVIASIHSNLKMDIEHATTRIIRAIENPHTHILGHLTGRLLLSRQGYPLDFKKIIDACAANQVVIEINANPNRLDLDWRWVDVALSKNVLLSINPDAHTLSGFDDIRYGCKVAQKTKLSALENLSSFSLVEFEKFMVSQHRKRNLQPL